MERKNTEKKNTEKKSTENKKDKAFVAVVSGLKRNQAGDLEKALINALWLEEPLVKSLNIEIKDI